MGKFISGLSFGLGGLIILVGGVWGAYRCFQIAQDSFGTLFAIISLVLFPALLSLAPWYEGLVNGDWMALMVLYGGGIVATGLFFIGSSIDGD